MSREILFFLFLITLGILAMGLIGYSKKRGYFWLLVDERGKYSLSRLQLFSWTIVVAAGFFAMAIQQKTIDIEIPENLLILMGFSLTASVGSQAIKSYKSNKPVRDTEGKIVYEDVERKKPKRVLKVLGSEEREKIARHFTDVFSVEETDYDDMLDMGKFQMFWWTIVALGLYFFMIQNALVTGEYCGDTVVGKCSLPQVSSTIVALMGLSQGAYLATKIPD
jgi:hypothetical protein